MSKYEISLILYIHENWLKYDNLQHIQNILILPGDPPAENTAARPETLSISAPRERNYWDTCHHQGKHFILYTKDKFNL